MGVSELGAELKAEPGAGGAMTRAIGIDPGTVSFDVCGRDGDRLFLDRTLSTVEVGADPGRLVDILRSAGPVDSIVGPSGYGLPWVGVEDLGPDRKSVV